MYSENYTGTVALEVLISILRKDHSFFKKNYGLSKFLLWSLLKRTVWDFKSADKEKLNEAMSNAPCDLPYILYKDTENIW